MKRLIVCCDGTWQRPIQNWRGDASPTNVVRLAKYVAKDDGTHLQVVWYDQGVGTGNVLDRVLGGLTGHGLDENIIEAYRFLVANYAPGDELFLFGFSRGAYTVRSLAGMIRKCGIVRQDKLPNYGPAIELYRDDQQPDDPGPTEFRRQNSVTGSQPIPVKLVGVWDTVGALGIPGVSLERYRFHDTQLWGAVEYAYQALAVDERRRPFAPTLWTSLPKAGQTIEQVWFSGTHSDIGGGLASHGLPDLSLQWMIDKARGAGLAFDADVMAAYPLYPDPVAHMNPIERSPFWKLTRTASRRIGMNEAGALDPTQSLHPSVTVRWDSLSRYRPANLKAYYAAIGDPRGGGMVAAPTWRSTPRSWGRAARAQSAKPAETTGSRAQAGPESRP